jgi:hypothetical protein
MDDEFDVIGGHIDHYLFDQQAKYFLTRFNPCANTRPATIFSEGPCSITTDGDADFAETPGAPMPQPGVFLDIDTVTIPSLKHWHIRWCFFDTGG